MELTSARVHMTQPTKLGDRHASADLSGPANSATFHFLERFAYPLLFAISKFYFAIPRETLERGEIPDLTRDRFRRQLVEFFAEEGGLGYEIALADTQGNEDSRLEIRIGKRKTHLNPEPSEYLLRIEELR
jgi:hypothetical protein